MKEKACKELDKLRIGHGLYSSKAGDMKGLFLKTKGNVSLRIMSSGHQPDWEHVSVSLENRCPNWQEMNFVKNLFWDESETVVQFHPKKSDYVNVMPYCLHLWKRVGEDYDLPPQIYV